MSGRGCRCGIVVSCLAAIYSTSSNIVFDCFLAVIVAYWYICYILVHKSIESFQYCLGSRLCSNGNLN